ncbi:MAG: ABC transporter ATP-binding protein [Verrucomicrobiales bacterium]|jgi:ABC-2 type transport system ATP-binding protein|nr:ABC transporter ATP-binding protein [Verrucomicrobiales bacterium]
MNANHPEPAIALVNVSRYFSGGQLALNTLTLSVPRGGVYGLLGRNGAGKTTAIKIMAGLLRPDTGTVSVLGKDPFTFTPADRQRVGYMSEKQILPANYRVGALADFCAAFYPRWNRELVAQLLGKFNIGGRRKIKELSHGTQRQVAFILALAQRPELLILDEPAATLDVVARREFLDEILRLLRDTDGAATILISSHILSDLERIADHVGIIARGQVIVSEPLDELAESVRQIRFHSFRHGAGNFTYPGALRTVRGQDEVLVTVRLRDPAEPARVAARYAADHEVRNLNLEDIFYELATR